MEIKADIYAITFMVFNATSLYLAWRSKDWRLLILAIGLALTQNICWLLDPGAKIIFDNVIVTLGVILLILFVQGRTPGERSLGMHRPWWLVPVVASQLVLFAMLFIGPGLSHLSTWRIVNGAYAVQILAVIATSIRRIVAPRHQFWQ